MRADIIPSVSHVRRACGKDGKVVVRCRQGVVDLYEKPETRNPDTAEQKRTRSTFGESAAKWGELPAEVKAGWNGFAAAHGQAFGRLSAEPLTGYRLYKSAAFFRDLLELGDPPAAPAGMPPPPPVRVELLPSAEDDTLRLRLEHTLKPGSFSVVVSMTPPTLRPSRKPDERNKRYVKGLNAASTAPLPAGGGEVTFTGCRFSVAPGRRFGVWVRIVCHGDGLASPELALDFIRPEAAEEPGAGEDAAPEPVAPFGSVSGAHSSATEPPTPLAPLGRTQQAPSPLQRSPRHHLRPPGSAGILPAFCAQQAPSPLQRSSRHHLRPPGSADILPAFCAQQAPMPSQPSPRCHLRPPGCVSPRKHLAPLTESEVVPHSGQSATLHFRARPRRHVH